MDYYREQYDITSKELLETKEKLQSVLNKLVYVKNTFETNYYFSENDSLFLFK